MDNTFKLVSVMVSLMQTREKDVFSCDDEKRTHYGNWTRAIEVAKTHLASRAPEAATVIAKMVDAMEMQDYRETQEFHVTAEVALSIWNPAREVGEAFLKTASAEKLAVGPKAQVEVPAAVAKPATVPVSEAEGYLKQRADSMGRALSKFGVSLKHGQLLTVVARMEGRECFQAMKSSLRPFVPNFCPHCGAAASLSEVGSVFCEQGEYNGKSYEAEGEGVQYACTRCNGQFTDWCGLDASEKDADACHAIPDETPGNSLPDEGAPIASSDDLKPGPDDASCVPGRGPYHIRIFNTPTGKGEIFNN
jgi:hypothetical protein